MIQEILLNLSWPNWLFAIAALFLTGIAYLFYFRTLPPLSSLRRSVVFLMRALSLAIVLFLILEPALRTTYQQNEKPVIAVLLDNSASMKIPEKDGLRGDSIQYIQTQLKDNRQLDSLALKTFQFDLNTKKLTSDSLDFAIDGSDITNAIQSVYDSLSGENLQGIVLVSDGIYNQGSNPFLRAQSSPAPIYTVLVGDTSLPKDIAIQRVQANRVTYVNKKLPVEVSFWQNGFDGKKALLTVLKDGRQVAQRTVTLGKSGFEQKAEIELVAKEAGDFNYNIRIQALDGEITGRNNQQNVRIQVLKSKIKVLVLSGSPNFDRHSLSYAGDQLDDYDFTFLTEKSSGQYFENTLQRAHPDSQDLFMFYGFPTANTSNSDLDVLMTQVRNRKVPIFWVPSKQANYQKLAKYEALLPFQPAPRMTPLENRFVRLTSGGRAHPVTRLDENETANTLLWKELPPLEIYRQIQGRKGAQVLLEPNPADESRQSPADMPVICYVYRQNEIKNLVFNGTNFANWHFQLQEDPAREQFFLQFMERAVRWLVNRDDIHQVQVKPLQPVYNVGEPVVFSGQVYDEFYQSLGDAQVAVTIRKDSLQVSDEMIAEGNGFYRQSFSGLPEGDFTYRIEARRNDKRVGVRSGKFTVKPFFLEFQQIPANYALMQQIAEETGGKLYSPKAFAESFPEQRMESRIQFASYEYFLWNYWQWLAALIFLLGTEWFLRKRWGLL